jgi:hypothetical protein
VIIKRHRWQSGGVNGRRNMESLDLHISLEPFLQSESDDLPNLAR